MNPIIALTQRPLTERGWGNGQIAKDVPTWYKGDVWFTEEIAAKANQALADQPLLWEEITRIQQKADQYDEAAKGPMTLREVLLAEHYEKELESLRKEIMLSHDNRAGRYCSCPRCKLWRQESALSIPSVPTPVTHA